MAYDHLNTFGIYIFIKATFTNINQPGLEREWLFVLYDYSSMS